MDKAKPFSIPKREVWEAFRRSRWRGATLETIRRTFVKIALRVEELKGSIRLALPAVYPHQAMLAAITGAITTRGP